MAETTPKKAEKKRILIVEDEEYLRDIYSEILEEAGFETVGVSNGEDGYREIIGGGYDLVLLDIMLPKMDGLEILERLRKNTSFPRPKEGIVLLTNLSKDLAIYRGLSMGVRGYLVKSDYTPGEIVEKVKEYLGVK